MYEHMKRCSAAGGCPANSVITHVTIATKKVAIDQRKTQIRCGIASRIRKKTVSRFRRRSSSTTSCTGCVATRRVMTDAADVS